MSGFRRAKGARRRAGDEVIGTFAPFEAQLLRQFAHELVLLLQAEAGAGEPPAEELVEPGDEFAAIAARVGLVGDSLDRSAVVRPEDPVLARLLPDAYADDDESAAEFRRFTQAGLVERKHASAQSVLASLPEPRERADEDADLELALDHEAALDWLGTLNDIRLALGVRLGVEQDDDGVWAALPDGDPRATVHEIYQWLGWVQETLVTALPRPR